MIGIILFAVLILGMVFMIASNRVRIHMLDEETSLILRQMAIRLERMDKEPKQRYDRA